MSDLCDCGHEFDNHNVDGCCNLCKCQRFGKENDSTIDLGNENESMAHFQERKCNEIIDLLNKAKESQSLMQYSVNNTLLPHVTDPKKKIPVIQINVVIDEMFLNKFFDTSNKLT